MSSNLSVAMEVYILFHLVPHFTYCYTVKQSDNKEVMVWSTALIIMHNHLDKACTSLISFLVGNNIQASFRQTTSISTWHLNEITFSTYILVDSKLTCDNLKYPLLKGSVQDFIKYTSQFFYKSRGRSWRLSSLQTQRVKIF